MAHWPMACPLGLSLPAASSSKVELVINMVSTLKPTLLVLAAGIGSRYGGLKQIDPIGPYGETIIDYSIFDAIRAGFGEVVFVIRRDIETDFRASIGQKFEQRIEVTYAYQELNMLPDNISVLSSRKKPWGTGHAVLVAENFINEPFAVINADDFYGMTSFQLLGDYLRTVQDSLTANYAMVGFTLWNTLSEFGSVARGVCQSDAQNFLKHIVETTDIEKEGEHARYTDAAGKQHLLSGDETVSMNMWGFTVSIFDHLRHQFLDFLQKRGTEESSEFYIPTVVNNLISQGLAQVKVLPSPASWFGVTYKEDRPYVVNGIKNLISTGVYPKRLWD